MQNTAEHKRLIEHQERTADWRQWGPYLSDRAWGTVREDYSADGNAWDYFPHDHARSRAYRWNEDGLAGISDRQQYLCFALALWNGRDPILKERFFGLNGPEGNHGEDVKEQYYYLDNTPTHAYMKMIYKYPQRAYPYRELVDENGRRSAQEPEYELLNTAIFEDNAYFDVVVEYAKVNTHDILCRITVHNRAQTPCQLHLLPTLWFRNSWSWGYDNGPRGNTTDKPRLRQSQNGADHIAVQAQHSQLGDYYFYAAKDPNCLFTENETNRQRLYGQDNESAYTKDAFHRYFVEGDMDAVNPDKEGSKMAVHYRHDVHPDKPLTIHLRLSQQAQEEPFADFEAIFQQRQTEANQFYEAVQPDHLTEDQRNIQRQAFAGLLWSKQLYYYDVEQWLNGDPAYPAPPEQRKNGRNSRWRHLVNFDIISMPDKWEYPWYATWDLAFHCLPYALIDTQFAKRQLTVFTREWYMHPNGQLPAYEWAFQDVNPPVHAWAARRVYQIDAKLQGQADRSFLEDIFHKLMLNFTWWVNRKDAHGDNIFEGGFLGLDNISVFDRSSLPVDGHIDQSDGTSWMGMYSLGLMQIALELAKENPVYQNAASKLFEHFLRIATAMTKDNGTGSYLWDEEDGFFYDALHLADGRSIPLKVRSLVGLIPILAVETVEHETLEQMDVFNRRMNWFLRNKPNFAGNVICDVQARGVNERHLFAFLTKDKLVRILEKMLDEEEFLSPHGIRSLSKVHEERPFRLELDGLTNEVPYWPAESQNGMFGGNSNWRGPVWFPINYLLIEALQKFHYYYGDSLKVAFPTGSDNMLNLWEVSVALSKRLISIFERTAEGTRPVYGGSERQQQDPHWRDHILFYEYFHGDNGAGLGASHQTGWTALVAKLIQQSGGVGFARD